MVLQKPKDISEIKRLNEESFPKEEQIQICDLECLAERDEYALLAAYEAERFIGFTFLVVNESCIYLFLLAVRPELRSKGYGRKIVQNVCKAYPACQVVVDIQPIDEPCDNFEQRLKRRKFYLNNGFCSTDYCLLFNGMNFDLLCSRSVFDRDAFAKILKKMRNDGFILNISERT